MADAKVTELVAITDTDGNDILYIVDDPGGTPVSSKITVTNLLKTLIAAIGSATDNAIVRWDGTGGATVQDSGATVTDSGYVIAGQSALTSTPGPNSVLQFDLNVDNTPQKAGLVGALYGGIYWSILYAQGSHYFGLANGYVRTSISNLQTAGANLSISPSNGSGNGIRVDTDVSAGNTRLLIYDVDNATLERVSVGAADSGGTGYKVLRIPN